MTLKGIQNIALFERGKKEVKALYWGFQNNGIQQNVLIMQKYYLREKNRV